MTVAETGFVLSPYSELNFWLRIMKEHAMFMRDGFEAARMDLKEDAESFVLAYSDLEKKLHGRKELGVIIRQARPLTREFLAFKLAVLRLLLTCSTGRNGGSLYPLLIDHIAREAQQFLSLLDWCDKAEKGAESRTKLLIEQEVFWLRQMSDHAKFIRGLLDPSERKFVAAAENWSVTFDRLLLQARDLESMQRAKLSFPTIMRFTGEVIEETKGLRDFKRAAEKLLEQCQVLSLISPLLADHVAREAEHFLEIMQTLSRAKVTMN